MPLQIEMICLEAQFLLYSNFEKIVEKTCIKDKNNDENFLTIASINLKENVSKNFSYVSCIVLESFIMQSFHKQIFVSIYA